MGRNTKNFLQVYVCYLFNPSLSFSFLLTFVLFVHSCSGSRILEEKAVNQFHEIEQIVVVLDLRSSRRTTLGSVPYTRLYSHASEFPKCWEGPQAKRLIAPAHLRLG